MNRQSVIIGFIAAALASCGKGDHDSPDLRDPSLLPDRGDYLSEDYGTQAYASELAGRYDAELGLVFYDAETRSLPQLYLTSGPQELRIAPLPSGAATVSFDRFSTVLMPLELSVSVKTLLDAEADTIYLRGTDGSVRTSQKEGTIGTPMPESDDAELMGKYARATGTLELHIDPMLPVPVKMNGKGVKK